MDIEKIPIKIKAILGRATIGKVNFETLKIGDVVLLDQKITDPLPLFIEEEVKLQGFVGIKEGRRAIKVERHLNE